MIWEILWGEMRQSRAAKAVNAFQVYPDPQRTHDWGSMCDDPFRWTFESVQCRRIYELFKILKIRQKFRIQFSGQIFIPLQRSHRDLQYCFWVDLSRSFSFRDKKFQNFRKFYIVKMCGKFKCQCSIQYHMTYIFKICSKLVNFILHG